MPPEDQQPLPLDPKPPPGPDSVAEAILSTLRVHLGLTVGAVAVVRPGVGQVWRVEASDPTGQKWSAEDASYYRACCLLAELVGFDLEG